MDVDVEKQITLAMIMKDKVNKPFATANPISSAEQPSAGSYEPPGNIPLSDRLKPGLSATGQDESQMYIRALDSILSTWPEYGALREINVSDFSPTVLDTLQQLLKRMHEQHTYIKRLSEENHETKQALSEIQEERDANAQALHRRELEAKSLREDVFILRSELRHLGQDVRLGDVGRSEKDPGDGLDLNTSGHTDMSPPSDPEYRRFKLREREGIYRATPLLQAEGFERSRIAVVQRTHSLKPVDRMRSDRDSGYTDSPSPSRTDSLREADDLINKLRRLELQLERERRENESLRERLENQENVAASTSTVLHQRNSTAPSVLTDKFRSLEATSAGKISTVISHHLNHASEKRQRQFICAVMQKSYDLSLSTAQQFRNIIQGLLLNPVKVDVSRSSLNGDLPSRTFGAVSGQIKRFEVKQPHDHHLSKLAMRTQMAGEVPEVLMTQIGNFLENMADVTNLASLIENVVDCLRQEYHDCTTSALLNHSTFNQFLHECCRLCWQMCVQRTPMVVSSTDRMRFDERSHTSQTGANITNAQIDFYAWPMLLSKSNGEVLSKGCVVLKL